MVEKVTFDADNRLILVEPDITLLDIEANIYSAAKRRWKDDTVLNKLRLPFRSVAGDPLGQNREIGAYFFLQNQTGADWRIRPDEADHELILIGNLYAENADLPMFVPTMGAYTVTISMDRSSLTQVVLSGSGVTQQDKEDIANEVWDHTTGIQVSTDLDAPDQYKADVSGLALESSIQALQADLDNPAQYQADLTDLTTLTEAVKKMLTNRLKIDSATNTMTIYQDNGITPFIVFNLKNKEGAPASEGVYERVPQ